MQVDIIARKRVKLGEATQMTFKLVSKPDVYIKAIIKDTDRFKDVVPAGQSICICLQTAEMFVYDDNLEVEEVVMKATEVL